MLHQKMDRVIYLLVISFGFLSVYNFWRDLEVNSRVIQLEQNPQGGERHRRAVNDEDDDSWEQILKIDLDKFNHYIKTKSKETFQEEINRALLGFLSNLPSQQLCKLVKNCEKNCEEEEKIVFGEEKIVEKTRTKCVRGPPGPPGPPGPEGPKGLGLEKPTLVQNTLDKGVVNLTDSKIFECKFFGSPIPEVSWKSPKSQFIINDTIDKESSTITSRLILTNISWYDQGPVKCNAKSLLGEDSGYGNLSTLSKPVISMNKKLVFAPERINFTFPECKVRSNPTAKVTWKRIFWSMPAGRVHVRENTLTINHVQYSDEGFYVCEADNFLGKDKKTIQLKIKPFEMHQTSASKIYIPSGENATISCSAYGNNHEMTGTITKSGEKISSKEEQKTGNLFEVKANVTSEGTYLCTIENRKEKAESATLVKHFKLSSSLLSSAQQSLVGRELRKINKIGKYKKCFGLSLPSTTFYTSCGGKKDTITFFRIKDMYKRNRYGSRYYAWGSRYIGGFTDLPWQKDNQMEYSNLTALFDLSNQRIYPSIEGREAVCYHDGYGPCFGNKDLYVASDGKIYRSSLGSSFNPKPTFNQKEVQFETFYLM